MTAAAPSLISALALVQIGFRVLPPLHIRTLERAAWRAGLDENIRVDDDSLLLELMPDLVDDDCDHSSAECKCEFTWSVLGSQCSIR